MLEPIKFLFILTGASTYLVTKYIKVGNNDDRQQQQQQSNQTMNNNSTIAMMINNNNHTIMTMLQHNNNTNFSTTINNKSTMFDDNAPYEYLTNGYNRRMKNPKNHHRKQQRQRLSSSKFPKINEHNPSVLISTNSTSNLTNSYQMKALMTPSLSSSSPSSSYATTTAATSLPSNNDKMNRRIHHHYSMPHHHHHHQQPPPYHPYQQQHYHHKSNSIVSNSINDSFKQQHHQRFNNNNVNNDNGSHSIIGSNIRSNSVQTQRQTSLTTSTKNNRPTKSKHRPRIDGHGSIAVNQHSDDDVDDDVYYDEDSDENDNGDISGDDNEYHQHKLITTTKMIKMIPTFEIEINDDDNDDQDGGSDDDNSLPKPLLQITLINDDQSKMSSDQKSLIHYFLLPFVNDFDDNLNGDYIDYSDDYDNYNYYNYDDYYEKLKKKIYSIENGQIDRRKSSSINDKWIDNRWKILDYFRINDTDGRIYLQRRNKSSLKYYQQHYNEFNIGLYRLNVYAKNIRTNQILSIGNIFIYSSSTSSVSSSSSKSLNANNNRLYFLRKFYRTKLMENNSNSNQKLIQINAIYNSNDVKQQQSNQLQYSIVKNYQNNQTTLFKIDSTNGLIMTNVCCFDRESQPNYEIIVQVVDRNDDNNKANTTVIIDIMDENDSWPKFVKNEYHLNIDEYNDMIVDDNRNNVILHLIINDNDLPETNRFRLRIIDEKFTSNIDEYNRWINDYHNHYHQNNHHNDMDSKLIDNGNYSSNYFRIVVPQTSSMSNDNDNGNTNDNDNNNVIHGQLINDHLKIYGRTQLNVSLLLIKKLDYEIPSNRFVMIKLMIIDDINDNDHNDNYDHYDYCIIFIRLNNLNDNSPKLYEDIINVNISESTAIDTIVAKFAAYDPDVVDDHDVYSSMTNYDNDHHHHFNETVRYRIDPQTNRDKYFYIDSKSGHVHLNRRLDRETISKFQLKIIATDFVELNDNYDDNVNYDRQRPRPSKSTATLIVNVDDVNDNAPFIINKTLPVLMENMSPVQKLGELYAFDYDDYSKGNGPPFHFEIDKTNDPWIDDSFDLKTIENNNENYAILYSKKTFDREQRKHYQIPIIVSDSGHPHSLSSTCLIDLIIGDQNDNRMSTEDGWKNVHVLYLDLNQLSSNDQHNHHQHSHRTSTSLPSSSMKSATIIDQIKSLYRPVEIGRINVDDPDDWDSGDKKFSWYTNDTIKYNNGSNGDNGVLLAKKASATNINDNFIIDSQNGQIRMKKFQPNGHDHHYDYQLLFQVYDNVYKQTVRSSMNIRVQSISFDDILNSGSLRIKNFTNIEDFIRIWDRKQKIAIQSHKERLQSVLKNVFNANDIKDNVDSNRQLTIISIQWNNKYQTIDVYFSVKQPSTNGKSYLSSLYLNTITKYAANYIRKETGLNIVQFGINECMLNEHQNSNQCKLNCMTETLIDWTRPYSLIDANYSSFLGVNLLTKAKCQCFHRQMLDNYVLNNQKFNLCNIDQILCQSPFDYFNDDHNNSIDSIKTSSSCDNNDNYYDNNRHLNRLNLFTNSMMTSITNLNYRCLFNNYFTDVNNTNTKSSSSSLSTSSLINNITNIRSFKSDGVVWLDPLPICNDQDDNVLSIQISTTDSNGIIFYYGPVISSKSYDYDVILFDHGENKHRDDDDDDQSDFMYLELVDGSLRLLFNFGSDIEEIQLNQIDNDYINDGNWHQIDIHFNSKRVLLMLDECTNQYHRTLNKQYKTVQREYDLNNNGDNGKRQSLKFDQIPLNELKKCQNYSIITKFKHNLNVNAPLQLGGIELLTTTKSSMTSSTPSSITMKILSKYSMFNDRMTNRRNNQSIIDDNKNSKSSSSLLPSKIIDAIMNYNNNHDQHHHRSYRSSSSSSSSLSINGQKLTTNQQQQQQKQRQQRHQQQQQQHIKHLIGFNGCIKNVMFNNHKYDLINVHHSHNTQIGCHSAQSLCSFLNKKCQNNGHCDGNYNQIHCDCPFGYYGNDCEHQNVPILFLQKSFLQLSLNFVSINNDKSMLRRPDLSRAKYDNNYVTKIELYFRTRQWQAQLIKLIGMNKNQYLILEIRNAMIQFRYNLNPLISDNNNDDHYVRSDQLSSNITEHSIKIDTYLINDGRWHRVFATLVGQSSKLILDNGGIDKMINYDPNNDDDVDYYDSDDDDYYYYFYYKNHHQSINQFKINYQQIMIGGSLDDSINYDDYNDNNYKIINDFANGCISDLKINDITIPLGDLLSIQNQQHRQQQPPINDLNRSNKNNDHYLNNKSPINHHLQNNKIQFEFNSNQNIQLSIIKQQNIQIGCRHNHHQTPTSSSSQSSLMIDLCTKLNCQQPFVCVDEWMSAKCICPEGFVEINDNGGKNCIKKHSKCDNNDEIKWQQNQNMLNHLPCGSMMVTTTVNDLNDRQDDVDCLQHQSSMNYSIRAQIKDLKCSNHHFQSSELPQPFEDHNQQQSKQFDDHYLPFDNMNQFKLSPVQNNNDNMDKNNKDRNYQSSTTSTTLSSMNAHKFQLVEYYGLFAIILFILIPLNIPFIIYIAYVCIRNRRNQQQQQQHRQNDTNIIDDGGGHMIKLDSLNYQQQQQQQQSIVNDNVVIGCYQSSSMMDNLNIVNDNVELRDNIIYYDNNDGGSSNINDNCQNNENLNLYNTMMYPLQIQIQPIHHPSSDDDQIHQQQRLLSSITAATTTPPLPPAPATTGSTGLNDVWQELTVMR